MKIRALFVDLGGVVVVNKAREIGEKYEKSDGLTPEMTKKVFRFIQTAKRTENEINSFLVAEDIDPELWKRYTTEFYSSECKNDNLVELLFQTKKAGILIVFTTNNSDAVMKGVKKYNIEGLADLIINSSEFKVAKPDNEFWEIALKETKKILPELNLEEVLVIDDSKTNCLSAIDFGFKAYQYVNDSKSQLEISSLVI